MGNFGSCRKLGINQIENKQKKPQGLILNFFFFFAQLKVIFKYNCSYEAYSSAFLLRRNSCSSCDAQQEEAEYHSASCALRPLCRRGSLSTMNKIKFYTVEHVISRLHSIVLVGTSALKSTLYDFNTAL